MSVAIRGVKNALRNKTRTTAVVLVLAVAIGLTLSMLVANEAVRGKLETLHDELDTTVTANPAFDPMSDKDVVLLSDTQLEKLGKLDHVESISGLVSASVQKPSDTEDTTGSGAGPTIMMGGAPGGKGGETDLESAMDAAEIGAPEGTNFPIPVNGSTDGQNPEGGAYDITDGRALTEADDRGAVISDQLAEKNDLAVGDTFEAFDEDITIVGIAATDDFDDVGIAMTSKAVKELAEVEGYNRFAVEVDDPDNIESVTEAMEDELGKAVEVKSNSEAALQATSGLETVKDISGIGFWIALFCAAVIVFFILTMTVRERRKEVGVLKAIGGTSRGVIAQFGIEAVTMVAIGAVLGLGVAAASSNAISDVLVATNTPAEEADGNGLGAKPGMVVSKVGEKPGSQVENAADLIGDITAGVGWQTLGLGLAIALAIAILGSALPAWLIARVRPAEVLRGE